VPVYVAVGALVWLGFHESGVHATIAGVLLGLLTPTERWVPHGLAGEFIARAGRLLSGEGIESVRARAAVRQAETAAREVRSPVERLEMALHSWSSFLIMPVFALANAGVAVEPRAFGEPVALAVAAGLVLGKPLGILTASFLAVRLGVARLPEGVTWPVMAGAGLLAGIGFTMALFIAGLALSGPLLDAAKVGILGASLVAGVVGFSLLRALLPPGQPTAPR
jgi:NhaA family Na+:H+ antiporter